MECHQVTVTKSWLLRTMPAWQGFYSNNEWSSPHCNIRWMHDAPLSIYTDWRRTKMFTFFCYKSASCYNCFHVGLISCSVRWFDLPVWLCHWLNLKFPAANGTAVHSHMLFLVLPFLSLKKFEKKKKNYWRTGHGSLNPYGLLYFNFCHHTALFMFLSGVFSSPMRVHA